MTRANWPQMEVVTSIEGEGMRCCWNQKHQKQHLLLIVSLLHHSSAAAGRCTALHTLPARVCVFTSV